MIGHKIIFSVFIIPLFLFLCSPLHALQPPSNLEDTDHAGTDWTISVSTVIAGKHINLRTFTINSGVTVTVWPSTVTAAPWNNGDVGRYGRVEIRADSAAINGPFLADGSGFQGGIGTNGYGPGGGTQISGSFCYSAAGGGYGGKGGNGTIAQGGPAYGDTYSTGTFLGSGGGGGSGVGESGGNGGGAIFIQTNYFLLNGNITAIGSAAQTPTRSIGSGGLGGGSGGNISLVVSSFDYVSGQIKANGGSGSSNYSGTNCGSYYESGGSGSGGRVQVLIFANGTLPSSAVNVAGANNGTMFYLAKPSLNNPNWSSSDVSVTSITARWKIDISSVPQKYRVEFSTSIDFSIVTTSETFNLFVSSAGLTPSTSYFFRVASIHPSTPSILSSFVVSNPTVTLPSTPTLNSPNWSALDLWTTSATARWNANGNPQTVRYRVDFSTSASFTGTVTSSETYSLYFSSTSLSPNTTIAFRVQSIGINDYRTQFITSVVTCTLVPAPTVSAWAETDIWTSSVTARWTNNGGTGVRYRVDFASSVSFAGTVTSSYTYNVYATSAGLTSNTTIAFRVQAINYSNVPSNYDYSLTTGVAPKTPTFYSIIWDPSDMSNTVAGLRWHGDVNPIGTKYEVQFATSSDYTSPGILKYVDQQTCFNCLDSWLTSPNTPVIARIRAIGIFGRYSDWAITPTTATYANAPIVDSYSVYSTSLSVTLSANSNYTGTTVQISTGNYSISNSSVGTLSGDPTTLFLPIISTYNSSYTVTARTVNFQGLPAGGSAVVSSATLAGVPDPCTLFQVPDNWFSSMGVIMANYKNQDYFMDNNPTNGTTYQILLSSVGSFSSGVIQSSVIVTRTSNDNSCYFYNLIPLTVYHARSRVISKMGIPTAYVEHSNDYMTRPAVPILNNPNWAIADIGLTSVTARWQSNNNPPSVATYRIQFATSSDFTSSGITLTQIETADLYASSISLSPNRSICFRVLAKYGSYYYSNYMVSVVTCTYASTPTLNSPNWDSADVGYSSVTARWNSNGNPGQTIYRVQFATSTDFDSPGITITENTTTNLSFSSSCISNSRIAYRVRSESGQGIPCSYIASESTYSLSRSPSITGFVVYTTSISVALSSNHNPAGTLFYVSTGNFSVSDSSSGVSSAGITTLLMDNLSPNTGYIVKTRSSNYLNIASSFTTVASTTTLVKPHTVEGYSVFTTSASIVIGANGNPPGTQIAVSTGNNNHFAVSLSSIGYIGGQKTTLTIFGLTPNTVYGFQSGVLNVTGSTIASIITASSKTFTAPHTVPDMKVYVTSVAITIGANGNPDGTQIVISTGTNGDFAVEFSSIGVTVGANTTLYIRGLATSTAYGFQSGSLNYDGSTNTLTIRTATHTLAVTPSATDFSFSTQAINVSFDLNTNPDNSIVEISSQNFSVSNTSCAVINSWGPPVILSGLIPNTTYSILARAKNWNGIPTALSLVVSSCTQASQPGALNFVEVNLTSITVNWPANGNPSVQAGLIRPTSYQMDISRTINFQNYTTSITFTNSVTTTGLISNETYYFRCRAFNRRGVPSEWSSGSVFTGAQPLIVNGFQVWATSVTVLIGKNGNAIGANIKVSTGTDNNFSVSLVTAGVITGDITLLTLCGLSTNTAYSFQAGIISGESPIKTGVTDSTYTASVPPLLSVYSRTADSFSITLNRNGNPEGTIIELSTGNFEPSSVLSGTGVEYIIGGLSASTAYSVRGRTKNQTELYCPSVVLFSTYTKSNPASAISLVKATMNTLRFAWSPNDNAGGISYRTKLYLGKEAELIETQVVATTSAFFSTNLKLGTQYTIYVCALNPDGTESDVISLSAQTKNSVSADPRVTVTTCSYSLFWETQEDADGHRVRDENNNLVAELPADASWYYQSGFSENQKIIRKLEYYSQYLTTTVFAVTFYTAVNPPKSIAETLTVLSKTATSMKIKVNPPGEGIKVRLRFIPISLKSPAYQTYLARPKYPLNAPAFYADSLRYPVLHAADPPGTIIVDFADGDWEKEITGFQPGISYTMSMAYVNSDGIESPVSSESMNLFMGFSNAECGVKAEKETFFVNEGVAFVVSSNESGNGTIQIYDINQYLIRNISFTYKPGFTRILWDGKDDAGNPIFTDVYWVKVETIHFGKQMFNVAGIR